MRLFIIFPCLLAMAWTQPLLKRKLLHNISKGRTFGVHTDCNPCGNEFIGVQPQPMVMAPNVYNAAAAPSAGQIYNSQEYSSGQMTHHFMNANAVETHHFGYGKRPAPVATAPIWIEGHQYNSYSPLGYTGGVMDNSAAAGAAASASAWSQQSGNYRPSNGHGAAFAQANSASWSSNHSG